MVKEMIYAIADLHLDHTGEKCMSVFGKSWYDYENKIFTNWNEIVKADDTVLIPGDISWGLKLENAYSDLVRIEELPGKKIILKGNHDYWWQSLKKLRSLGFKTIEFLQNNSYYIEEHNIIGARGWLSRDNPEFTEEDEVVFKRELIRLKLSLDSIKKDGDIIAILHYPPFNKDKKPNEFSEILEQYGAKICLYGHLHSEGLSGVVEGIINGIEYKCISSDYLNFKPILIKGE